MALDEQQGAVKGIKDPAKRKAAYYKLQREHAEESGDQGTTDKIYKKMGKSSHNVDSSRGDKAILEGVALTMGLRGLGGLGRVGSLGRVGKAVEGAGKAARTGEGLVKRGEGAIEGAYQRLSKPTPVKQSLGSSKPALGSAKNRSLSPAEKYSAKKASNNSPKSMQGNPRKALGSSGQGEWHAEVTKQAAKKMPAQPKTFNRNGTKRAEGRQKSTRNPVSKRKSVND